MTRAIKMVVIGDAEDAGDAVTCGGGGGGGGMQCVVGQGGVEVQWKWEEVQWV
jgi:hypothetical protein